VGIGSEFKEFAMKGNVVDLAVGVIIGAAFGKIVSSLVGDVFMPGLGKLIGGFNFSDLAVTLGTDPAGKEVLVKYGALLQTIFDFVIIALVLFVAIKGINKLKKPAPAAPAAPAPPPRSEVLLEEIRDLLAKRA
jgi:large conductance mechanosensitive channel